MAQGLQRSERRRDRAPDDLLGTKAMSRPTFNRSDTLLGVCEALGQDLGFNAQWLRVALCLGLFWSPTGVIAAYLLMGAAVYTARWLTPAKKVATVAPATEPAAINDDDSVELAKAA